MIYGHDFLWHTIRLTDREMEKTSLSFARSIYLAILYVCMYVYWHLLCICCTVRSILPIATANRHYIIILVLKLHHRFDKYRKIPWHFTVNYFNCISPRDTYQNGARRYLDVFYCFSICLLRYFRSGSNISKWYQSFPCKWNTHQKCRPRCKW